MDFFFPFIYEKKHKKEVPLQIPLYIELPKPFEFDIKKEEEKEEIIIIEL